ncbi:hypothetical protein GW17_00059479 [Ensete ventricosum]|nr:hypothetical protein GW17_00059479 [Ensete ventricosum]
MWNLHFATALADWVYDIGRVINMQAERIVALRSEVLDWKFDVGLEAVTTTEKWAIDLEAKVDHSRAKVECRKAALDDAKQHYQTLEWAAEKTRAITEYKVSRGFELDMERTRRTYEFEYRVVLKRFQVKYPDLIVKENPFTDYLEDANVEMENNQPFDDIIPPKD